MAARHSEGGAFPIVSWLISTNQASKESIRGGPGNRSSTGSVLKLDRHRLMTQVKSKRLKARDNKAFTIIPNVSSDGLSQKS